MPSALVGNACETGNDFVAAELARRANIKDLTTKTKHLDINATPRMHAW
jgi:hypothetical protein